MRGCGGGGQIVIEFIQCWNGIVKLRLSHWASVINTFKLRYHPMGMSGWEGGTVGRGGGERRRVQIHSSNEFWHHRWRTPITGLRPCGLTHVCG